MLIMVIIMVLLLIGLDAVRPIRSQLSNFELSRRVDDGDKAALRMWRRNNLFSFIVTFQDGLRVIFIICLTAAAIAEYDWLMGILLALVVSLWHQWLSRMVHKPIQNLYQKHELSVLKLTDKLRILLKSWRNQYRLASPAPILASREELLHIVGQNTSLTSQSERALFAGALKYEHEPVSSHMTKRGMIKSVDVEELIGPLVLDDLHKTGHDYFPVRDGDIDHVVGMLHIHDLASLKIKQSAKARDLMSHAISFINQDQTIASALKVFTRDAPGLLIVRDSNNQTTGVLSLEDIVDVLFDKDK